MRGLYVVAVLCAAAAAQSSSTKAEFEPGVSIPEQGTVFIVQHIGDRPELQRIPHLTVALNRHVGSNLAKANFAPMIAKLKASIDVKGTTAKTRVSDPHLAIYVHSPVRDEEEMKSDLSSEWHLLRLAADNDHRVVAVMGFGRLSGVPSNEYQTIASKVERLDSEWVKITSTEALTEGEYAVAQVPERKDVFGDAVFDFAVGK
jgi:DNA gyrase inhibitor GyrI